MGNRYLEDRYAPIAVEYTEHDLSVTGTLPPELDGRYLRNGPNPLVAPDPASYHWFLGDGMVHGVRLRDGNADWYRNRWVRSTAVSTALGEAPAPGERHMFDTANTNVIGHAGKTFAIVEAGACPVELTDELETVCHSDFGGTLPHGFTAHPKRDPETGELFAVNYYWGRPNVLEVVVVGVDGTVRRRLDVPVPGNPMVHDCSLTESFLVLYDMPVTFDLDLAAQGNGFPYGWNPDYGARIGLLPREGEAADVEWFDVEPCYVFHPLNAYDEGDTVVLDVVRHPRMFATDMHGPNEGMPSLWRWTVDRTSGKVREEQLDDLPVEFPRVDERVVGRRHRFGFAASFADATATDLGWDDTGLVRYDSLTGVRTRISFGPGRSCGE
ncbi:MAG: carotenoid oxygenase family protein, partial [Aquihabitans sp.]